MPWKDQATKDRAIEVARTIPEGQLGRGLYYRPTGGPCCLMGWLMEGLHPDDFIGIEASYLRLDFGWTLTEFDNVIDANDGPTSKFDTRIRTGSDDGFREAGLEALQRIPVEDN